jgi:UDP-N-acetylmuramate dehydrogenase
MKIYNNFDLTDYNAYNLQSECSKAYFPQNEKDIIDFFIRNERFTLLGSGHNVILSKRKYDHSFIIFNNNFDNIIFDKTLSVLEIESGVSMIELSMYALENNLTGLEMFYDIPSSLGGAVVMNAGASGKEIKDLIIKVRFLDLADMTIKELKKEELAFEYRNSFFQKTNDKIVLKAWLKLDKGNHDEIKEKMELIKSTRWAKQPKEYPNCGSVFKRPNGKFVGPMLDELGLKGFTIGGAQVSEKHSGFIINVGGATGSDILELIQHIQSLVLNKFKVHLEVEQRII